MISGLLYRELKLTLSAFSGRPSYQPTYSLLPITSSFSPIGSSMTIVVPDSS